MVGLVLNTSMNDLLNGFDTSDDAVVVIDPQNKIIYWNPASEKLFGWSEAEALNQPLTIIIPERHHKRACAAIQRYQETKRETGLITKYDIFAVRKDGTELPVSISLNTQNEMIIGFCQESHEDHAVKQEFRHATSTLTATLEALAEIDAASRMALEVLKLKL